MAKAARGARRREILEALASELEGRPGARITTARLAAVLGISEAALYRHFPSKADMFEALLDFAEDAVFTRSKRVSEQSRPLPARVRAMTELLLTFSERNPGITRVLMGEAVMGEQARLRERAAHFFERAETELRQLFRDAALEPETRHHGARRGRGGPGARLRRGADEPIQPKRLSPFSPRGMGGAVGSAGGGAVPIVVGIGPADRNAHGSADERPTRLSIAGAFDVELSATE